MASSSSNGGAPLSYFYRFPQLTREEKMEIRRSRGEMSCAECRRLKLKCDKQLPCTSCVRRGCANICPTGTVSNVKAKIKTEDEHPDLGSAQQMDEMASRIKQLEDALALVQSTVSLETHPLLAEHLRRVRAPPDGLSEGNLPQDDLVDALGTLRIGDPGKTIYYGRSGGSESLFMAGMDHESEDDPIETPASSMLRQVDVTLQFGPDKKSQTPEVEKVLMTLLDSLPPKPRAWTLCETYLEQGCWNANIVTREELVDDILTPIYQFLEHKNDNSPIPFSPHKLGVLLMVCALGALVDLTIPAYSDEAESYYESGLTALSRQTVLTSPEYHTVQAGILVALYHLQGGRRYTVDGAWTIIGLGARLAQSIGLHRESPRWNMDFKTVHRRRTLFWEIFCLETDVSLSLGRPPSMRLSYVDCQFPEDEDSTFSDTGEIEPGPGRWRYRFAKELLSLVTESTLSASVPPYKVILDLDRQIRQFKIPSRSISADVETISPHKFFVHNRHPQVKAATLLYIHRSFFAQAMLDHPSDPIKSPYAASFFTSYHCASKIIRSDEKCFKRLPELMLRYWAIWSTLFSAAVIMGAIVTRMPTCSIASTAFAELSLAVDMFEKGAETSSRARSGLVFLRKLMTKATLIYARCQPERSKAEGVSTTNDPDNTDFDADFGADELEIFGGHTKVLVSKILLNRRPPPSSSTPTTQPSLAFPEEASKNSDPSALNQTSIDAIDSSHSYLVDRHYSLSSDPSQHILPPLDHPQPPPFDPTTMLSDSTSTYPYSSNTDFQPWRSDNYLMSDETPYANADSSSYIPAPSVPDNVSDIVNELAHEGYPMDLDMMNTEEHAGLNAHWMSFMRNSGIFDERGHEDDRN